MSGGLLALVTVVYVLVALDFFIKGNFGMCVCFAGYALANIGIIIAT